MSLPIIFVREYYPQSGMMDLRPAILTATRWNPRNRVILIGDSHQPKDLCEFHAMEDYSENKRALRSIFKTPDTANEWFIWTTLSQWVVIYEWMAANHIYRACCLDTDVLIFADAQVESDKLGNWDFSRSCPLTACQAPTLMSQEAAREFTRFLFDLYNHVDGSDWQNILSVKQDSMSLWSNYYRLCDPKPRVVDTSKVVDGATFDHNWAMDYHGYSHDGHGRNCQWIAGQPWVTQTLPDGTARLVRFNSCHMWGSFKGRMNEFVAASEASLGR